MVNTIEPSVRSGDARAHEIAHKRTVTLSRRKPATEIVDDFSQPRLARLMDQPSAGGVMSQLELFNENQDECQNTKQDTKTAPIARFDDDAAKEALERYEGVVRMMARRLRPAAALGQALDEDDLCAEGRVAVLEGLATYQHYGISEKAWVRTRIRQRMIDAIRKLDLRSRDEMNLAVRQSNGEPLAADDYERGRVIQARRLVSIDFGTEDSPPLVERLESPDLLTAEERLDQRVQLARLRAAISALPDRQRQAVELGLFSGLSLRLIGEKMGISESRVCQLQKRAIHHLKRALIELEEREEEAA